MKAVAYYQNLPISAADSLVDVELPIPQPEAHDLLVEVKAIAVNPVDTKVRRNAAPQAGEAKVLGWDATGVVMAVGSAVSLFKVGDEVWYAGDISRQGSNSQYQVVDERIVGHKPQSLSFAEAAALPLTAITSYELLFDRLEVPKDLADGEKPASILVICAAGGVGSILVQLARKLTQLQIIGTASRPETADWLKALGAHEVINHRASLSAQLGEIGIAEVDYVISLTHTDEHFAEIVKCIKPQGKFALIDDPELFDFRQLKRKSVSLHWELMFTRALFKTPDMIKQNQMLNALADWVDAGLIKTTLNLHLGEVNAANLKKAHALLESGASVGKIVLSNVE